MPSKYIPGLFTLANLFFGFFAIVKAVDGQHYSAAWFIILAIICDGMDGKIARISSIESPFGHAFDTLSDLVSSGIAPGLLIYYGRLSIVPAIGVPVCFIYVLAGAYRLARFHVVQGGRTPTGYRGLPIPVSGITIASLWIFYYPAARIIPALWWIGVLLSLSFLMVTTIEYDWPRLRFKGRWMHVLFSFIMIACVVAFVVFPHYTLFPFFLLYILWGLAQYGKHLLLKESTLSGLFTLGGTRSSK
jgi:CDP-diacylglycerol--serine O-phosphatidyltransferase